MISRQRTPEDPSTILCTSSDADAVAVTIHSGLLERKWRSTRSPDRRGKGRAESAAYVATFGALARFRLARLPLQAVVVSSAFSFLALSTVFDEDDEGSVGISASGCDLWFVCLKPSRCEALDRASTTRFQNMLPLQSRPFDLRWSSSCLRCGYAIHPQAHGILQTKLASNSRSRLGNIRKDQVSNTNYERQGRGAVSGENPHCRSENSALLLGQGAA